MWQYLTGTFRCLDAIRMPLFWLTYDSDDELIVHIQEAEHLTMARMKASLAGQRGGFKEAHQLDYESARRIPQAMIGRSLSRKEAETLLKRLC
jgi:hypothetical protein